MKKIATDPFSLKTEVKCSWRFLIYKLKFVWKVWIPFTLFISVRNPSIGMIGKETVLHLINVET